LEETVAAVVCDLTHRHLTIPGGKLSVPLSNQVLGLRNRYQSPVLSRALPAILGLMANPEVGLLIIERGQEGAFGTGRRTTIEAGPNLLAMLASQGMTLLDLMHDNRDAEVIILKGSKPDGHGRSKELLPYQDTLETIRWRDEVNRINAWLAEADIYVDEAEATNIDAGERHLRRIFNNGSFRQGGRLFGGFWQGMKKAERCRAIWLNEEPVVELDYGQMALRVLYGLAGATPPEGDAYRIPGLEPYRKGVKKVINACLYSDKPLTRMPAGTRQHFPSTVSFHDLVRRIAEHHPCITQHLFSGIGMEVMFQESEVLIRVLLSLMDEGVTALPIHDAVLVRVSATDLTRTTMLSVFHQQLGVEGMVDIGDGATRD
jgi:hypothetical protein